MPLNQFSSFVSAKLAKFVAAPFSSSMRLMRSLRNVFASVFPVDDDDRDGDAGDESDKGEFYDPSAYASQTVYQSAYGNNYNQNYTYNHNYSYGYGYGGYNGGRAPGYIPSFNPYGSQLTTVEEGDLY